MNPQDAATERAIQELGEFATEIESTQLSHGWVSVDFLLIERSALDNQLEDQDLAQEEYEQAIRESPHEPNENVEEKAKKLAAGSGNAESVATQRSGGVFRSSIIIDERGEVVEYNIRLLPIDASIYSKGEIKDSISRLRRGGLAATGLAVEDVQPFFRPDGGKQGAPSQWWVHLRAEQASIPHSAMLAFVKFVVVNFGRFFVGEREWASPAVESMVWGGADAALDALASHPDVVDFIDERAAERGEREITFRFEGAEAESEIRAWNDEALWYDLRLPALDTDEFGKILLPKAVEHILESKCILVRSHREIEQRSGAYHPRIETDHINPLAEVARDARTLIDEYDTVRERSRLSG